MSITFSGYTARWQLSHYDGKRTHRRNCPGEWSERTLLPKPQAVVLIIVYAKSQKKAILNSKSGISCRRRSNNMGGKTD
jgi:hypothetical protein